MNERSRSDRFRPLINIIFRLARAFLVALVCQPVFHSSAQDVTLSDRNSTASIDASGPLGLSAWTIQGWNAIQQQSWFFGIANGPIQQLGSFGSVSIIQSNAAEALLTYANAGYSISVNYRLSGGTNVPIGPQYGTSTATSELDQTLTIHNTSPNPLAFHLYLYTSGTPGYSGDTAVLNGEPPTGPPDGLYHNAEQFYSFYPAAFYLKNVASIGADHGEVAPYGFTLSRLMAGMPVTLGDVYGPGPMTDGSSPPAWALQWDLNLSSGASISLMNNEIQSEIRNIPEPALLSLLAPGFGAWRCRQRRRLMASRPDKPSNVLPQLTRAVEEGQHHGPDQEQDFERKRLN